MPLTWIRRARLSESASASRWAACRVCLAFVTACSWARDLEVRGQAFKHPEVSQAYIDALATSFVATVADAKGARTGFRSLRDYQDRSILLAYWSSTCAGCGTLLRDLMTVHQKYSSSTFRVVVVVCVDDSTTGQTVAEEMALRGVNFDMLLDSKGHSRMMRRARDLPLTFLLDRHAEIRFRTVGIIPQIAASYWGLPSAGRRIREVASDSDSSPRAPSPFH